MLFKFIGDYTNGHTSITLYGVTFEGREPVEVDGRTQTAKDLSEHPEFEACDPLDHDGDGKKGGSRRKKVEE